MKTVEVPIRRWYDNIQRKLTFPDNWSLKKIIPNGHNKLALSIQEIEKLISNPLAGKSLYDIAKDKTEAVIAFDDMTRPTPTYDVAPIIIKILNQAGITDKHIRFVWALGSHGTYDLTHARKKLGNDIVDKFRIYNHNAFNEKNHKLAGITKDDVSLYLNKEYMNCDLKIGIESILPHIQAGWSGGGKLVVPGIASITTIENFHKSQFKCVEHTGFAKWKHNPMVSVFNEAAELSNLDFKLDCFINEKGEISDLFTGPPSTTYREGVKKAPDHYGSKAEDKKYDIVIANSYAKASEAAISFFLASQIVKNTGVIVLLSDIPEGQVTHYLLGSFGKDFGGPLFSRKMKDATKHLVRRIIFNMTYPDQNSCDMICHRDDVEVNKDWDSIIKSLQTDYPEFASVAVINDGTMQYFKD